MKKSLFLSVLVLVVLLVACGSSEEKKSNLCDMTAFSVDGTAWTFNGTDTWTSPSELAKGTTTFSKTPAITVSPKADYAPKGAVELINRVEFTVTAEDGTTKKYYAQARVATQ